MVKWKGRRTDRKKVMGGLRVETGGMGQSKGRNWRDVRKKRKVSL